MSGLFTVRRLRPGTNGGVRPENWDALTISQRVRDSGRAIYRRKGSGVSYPTSHQTPRTEIVIKTFGRSQPGDPPKAPSRGHDRPEACIPQFGRHCSTPSLRPPHGHYQQCRTLATRKPHRNMCHDCCYAVDCEALHELLVPTVKIHRGSSAACERHGRCLVVSNPDG